MILLERVSKHFEGRRRVTALEDVNLDIPKGELVSIVGPSGSGKSTLLNLIGGLDRPTAGTITLDGQRLDGLADDGLTAVRRDKLGNHLSILQSPPEPDVSRKRGAPAPSSRLAVKKNQRACA